MANCDSKLLSMFDQCSSSCQNSLSDKDCQKCLEQNCRTALAGELGKDINNETIECCVSKGWDNRPKPYDQFKGCFSQCSGGVDTSSSTTDIFNNCCGSQTHQECCQQTCLTEGAYQVKLFPQLIEKSTNGSDPVTEFCSGKTKTKSRLGAKVIDKDDPNIKPYCKQSSERDSDDPLFKCSCDGGPCDEALDWETCVLLNSEKILDCLKGSNYSEAQLEEAKEELAQLFCEQQNMGFNCRSCLICNYLNYANPQLANKVSTHKKETTLKLSPSKTEMSTTEKVFLGIGIVIILIISILLFIHFFGSKKKVTQQMSRFTFKKKY